jgi:hypothetical protein
MDDHDLRVFVDPLERLPHRILPALAAVDDQNWFCPRAQIGRRISAQVGRQRDDDLGNGVRVDERVDAALENRAAAEGGQLLRLPGTEAQPASTRGNDCGNVSSQEAILSRPT